MKQFVWFTALTTTLLTSLNAWSAFSVRNSGINYTIEPIVGYETVFRALPTPHTSTRLIYGARISAGVSLISGELEYTKGQDTENYLVAPEKVTNYDEKLKLGLKSTYNFNQYMFANARLGAQASKNTEEDVNGGITTKTEHDIKIAPYAGAGLGVRIANLITVNAGVTAVVPDTSDMEKNDYQYTLSIGIGR